MRTSRLGHLHHGQSSPWKETACQTARVKPKQRHTKQKHAPGPDYAYPPLPGRTRQWESLSWLCQREAKTMALALAHFRAQPCVTQAWPLTVGLEGSNLTFRKSYFSFCLYVNSKAIFGFALLGWTFVWSNQVWSLSPLCPLFLFGLVCPKRLW